jgi:hypothetical protein
MSTKIYDGFMFVPKNIAVINKKNQEFRHKIDKYITSEFNKFSAAIASNFIDNCCCGIENNEKNTSPFFYAYEYLLQETKKVKISPERSLFDYSCSATVHLYKDTFYGMLFCDNRKINEMWFQQEWIKKFGYWNNTDPLDGINYKDWEKRGKIWDKILKDFNYVPSMNGFTAELTRDMSYYVPFSVELIIPFIPSYDKRLHKISEYYLYKEFDQLKDVPKEYLSFENWIKEGNPGFEKFIEIKNKFAQKIPKEITKEMLLGK